MGLYGILLGLVLPIWLANRGWRTLLLAPGAAHYFRRRDVGKRLRLR